MGMVDFVLLAAIALAVILAVRSIRKARRSGKSCTCGGDCARCAGNCRGKN